MVILRRRQKIKQLEAGIEEAKAMFRTFVTEQRAYNKANDIQVK